MKKKKQLSLEEAAWLMFMDTPFIEVVGFLSTIGYRVTIELDK